MGIVIEKEYRKLIEETIKKYENRKLEKGIVEKILDDIRERLNREGIWSGFISFVRENWSYEVKYFIELMILSYELLIDNTTDIDILFDKDEYFDDACVVIKGRMFGGSVYGCINYGNMSINISGMIDSRMKISNEAYYIVRLFIEELDKI